MNAWTCPKCGGIAEANWDSLRDRLHWKCGCGYEWNSESLDAAPPDHVAEPHTMMTDASTVEKLWRVASAAASILAQVHHDEDRHELKDALDDLHGETPPPQAQGDDVADAVADLGFPLSAEALRRRHANDARLIALGKAVEAMPRGGQLTHMHGGPEWMYYDGVTQRHRPTPDEALGLDAEKGDNDAR